MTACNLLILYLLGTVVAWTAGYMKKWGRRDLERTEDETNFDGTSSGNIHRGGGGHRGIT